MLKKDVTLKMLTAIATMMNKVLGYKDPILTGKGILRKDLYDEVADAAQDIELGDLDHEDFTDDMITWLEVMGWEKPVALPVEEEKAEEPDEKVTKPEETPEPPVETEPKTEPAKEKAKVEPKKKAAKKTPAKIDPDAKKDEFGFRIDTKRNLFAESIRENPMTMAEVKQEDWNDPPQSFYQAWSVIKAFGKGKIDGKTMSISD